MPDVREEPGVPRLVGVETEYGILAVGAPDVGPVTASALVVAAHRELSGSGVGWDHSGEHPQRDARGFDAGRSVVDPSLLDDRGAANLVLTNGARLYVDHAHPEYSTPECTSARDLVRWDKAGERILAAAAEHVSRGLPGAGEIVIHKNNTDGKGAAYGTHENYLVPRSIPFGLLTRQLLPFFATRGLFVGAGRVGGEREDPVPFQLTQRADFFEVEVGLETTVRRPLMNTRDEPHADVDRFRRLHVINGDANLCEVATFLKVGTMLLVLDAIVSGALVPDVGLADPVQAFRTVSRDPSCSAALLHVDGRSFRAVDVQERYLEACRTHVERHGPRGDDVEVLESWAEVLDAVRTDPTRLEGSIDWATKLALLRAYAERQRVGWDDPRIALIDLQYHDLRPDRGLHQRLSASGRVRRVVDDEAVRAAMTAPPEDTRAWFRGECVRRFPEAVVAASWDGIVLDTGRTTLTRVPLLDPHRGTRAGVGDLLARAHDPRALLDLLSS